MSALKFQHHTFVYRMLDQDLASEPFAMSWITLDFFFSLCLHSKQVNVKQSSRFKLSTDIRRSEALTFNGRNKR